MVKKTEMAVQKETATQAQAAAAAAPQSTSIAVQTIPLPTGTRFKLYAAPDQDRVAILKELVLDYWSDYIEEHWLDDATASDGTLSTGETRVKRLLDACGTFLLKGDDTGLISAYMRTRTASREVPISACPEIASDALYSASKHGEYYDETGGDDILSQNAGVTLGPPRKRFEYSISDQVFTRLHKLKQLSPHSINTWCRVDTENTFEYNGTRYAISPDIEAYAGVGTRVGIYYAFDRVLVSEPRGNASVTGMTFYDQAARPLPDGAVTRLVAAGTKDNGN